MKKWKTALKVLCFVLLLAVLFGAASAIAQPVWLDWNNYNTTYGFYEEPENTIETVFLGASITINGITPVELYENYGICSYNLGTEQQPMLASYYWLEEAYRLHSETLDTVVLDVSMLRRTPLDAFYRKALDAMQFSLVKCRAMRDYSDSFEEMLTCLIPALSYHDRWESITQSDFQKLSYEPETCTRGYSFTTTQYAEVIDSYANIAVPPGEIDESAEATVLDEEALFYLDKMVQFCEEHGIRLVLMRTPVIGAWFSGDHNAVQALADTYGVDFLDFNFSPYLEEIDYNHATDNMDGTHMNYYGATKLTDWLGRYLTEECGNTDQRGTEKYAFMEEDVTEYHRYIVLADLQLAEDPCEYLSYLLEQGEYTIFISVKDDAANALTEEQREFFSSIGLEQLSELSCRDAYLAILDDGTLIDEQRYSTEETAGSSAASGTDGTSDTVLPLTSTGSLADGTVYTLTSGGLYSGNTTSCVLNGTEYSPGGRGLNFVVYDQKTQTVIDTVSFDTCSSDTGTSRYLARALSSDEAAGVEFADLSEAEQTLYLYNLMCTMKTDLADVQEDGLLTWLQYFQGSDDYTILISAMGDASAALSDEVREVLASMGLVELSDLENGDSYIAVIRGGEIQELCGHGDTPIEMQEIGYTIISGGTDSGNVSSILIGGTEYSGQTKGLNLAIFHNPSETVISTRSFDTSAITPLVPEDR